MIQWGYESREIIFRGDFAYLQLDGSRVKPETSSLPVARELYEQCPIALSVDFVGVSEDFPWRHIEIHRVVHAHKTEEPRVGDVVISEYY
jgi:hypothetical protein